MTIKDAVARGIPRLRRPCWAFADTYLRVDLLPDGMMGPWGHLYSRGAQERIGEPTPQVFLVIGDETDDYEPYDGKLDGADTKGY